MQNATSPPGAAEQPGGVSRHSDADHATDSKPTTANTGKRHRTTRRSSFRPDLTVHPRTATRREKSFTYEAPVSGRESWWRVTIKVNLKQALNKFVFYLQSCLFRKHRILERTIRILIHSSKKLLPDL